MTNLNILKIMENQEFTKNVDLNKGEKKLVDNSMKKVMQYQEMELRLVREREIEYVKVRSSKDVYKFLMDNVYDWEEMDTYEMFYVVFMNNANDIVGVYKHSQGGMTGTLVDPRLILVTALKMGAVGIILSHNHPSGTLIASQSDKLLTKKMQKAAETIDMKILDHVIVTHKGYFSFADENLL